MNEPYCGPAPMPAEVWSHWNLDPWLIGGIFALWTAQAWTLTAERGGRRRQLFLAGAWVVALVLMVSPLCALTSALFSARMAHHVVLMALVAPLLALALPKRWQAPRHSALVVYSITAIHAVLVWLWHSPWPYAAALESHAVFWVMELTLLGSAVFFWRAIASPLAPLGIAIMSLFFTSVQMGLLGALITFAPVALYGPHLTTTIDWNLTALEDQQLAGLLLWVVGALSYVAAAVLLAGSRLMEQSRDVR